MANLTWFLFDHIILENTRYVDSTQLESNINKLDNVEPHDETTTSYKNSDNPKKIKNATDETDGIFAICDAILDTYYIYWLKQLHLTYLEQEDIDSFTKGKSHLNHLSRHLSLFVHNELTLLNSLEDEYYQIAEADTAVLDDNAPDGDSTPGKHKALADSILQYYYFILKYLQHLGDSALYAEIGNTLEQYTEKILYTFSSTEPSSENYRNLSMALASINIKVTKCDFSNSSKRIIWNALNKIPLFLGPIYEKHYSLYHKILKLASIIHMQSSLRPLEIILHSNSFNNFCITHFQSLADYISTAQYNVCSQFIIDEDQFDEVCHNLIVQIKKIPNLQQRYIQKRPDKGGCFALMDTQLSSGERQTFITFSGVFDSNNRTIQQHFSWPKLTEAMKDIENALPGTNLVRTTADVPYYYQTSSGTYKFITILQACQACSDKELVETKRMFSCCEKKLLPALKIFSNGQYSHSTIYVKYECCDLCRTALDAVAANNYSINVIAGIQHPTQVHKKADYDKLAQNIYQHAHTNGLVP